MSVPGGQTKRGSWLEATINVAVGYSVALATQLIVFPIFGMEVTILQNLGIGAIFTVVSIVRSYLLRRVFNYFLVRSHARSAAA